MKVTSYATITQRAYQIQPDKYKAFVGETYQTETKRLAQVSEQLKKIPPTYVNPHPNYVTITAHITA